MNVVLPSLHKCRPIKYPIQFQTSRFIRTEQPHSHIHADDFASMLEHSSKICTITLIFVNNLIMTARI